MTDEELMSRFEGNIKSLSIEEVRKLLTLKLFGKCADCGKNIVVFHRRKRCDSCQALRNADKRNESSRKYYERNYKSTHYQKVVK